ncbi:hypothetical protein [Halorubrum sp. N11]|uniref:hypothetical protein n=1 Tax=Halorubrum sp. N11 TaxID=3402276 RepID=UPI003EB82692
MKLAKVTAGHWKDSGDDAGFSRRYQFADDCREKSKIAIGFMFDEGTPLDANTTTADIRELGTTDLKAMYEKEGVKEGKAKNAAEQIIRFRDWPAGTPLFLYLGRNTVDSIGYLKGSYEYEWDGHFHDEYGYPHVREIEWIDVPRKFSRSELPDDFQGWLTNPQTALDYTVSPRSEEADFLALSRGIGKALDGLGEGELSILR